MDKREQQLINAAKIGNIDEVREILNKKGLFSKRIEVDTKDEKGKAAITHASENGHTNLVKLLVDFGTNVNIKDNYGVTPLAYAVGNKHFDTFDYLLESGAEIDSRQDNGWTTLFEICCNSRDEEIVERLLDAGANPNADDGTGSTPLIQAACTGEAQIVKLLIDAGADVNAKPSGLPTTLVEAITSQHIDVLKLLLEAGADVNAQDDEGKTPLMIAEAEGSLEIMKLLLTAGADPNLIDAEGKAVLRHAVSSIYGYQETFKKDEPDDKTWARKTIEDHINIVKLLLDNGADVNQSDNNGITALMFASVGDDVNLVKILIEAGADLNLKNINGYTALMLAEKNNKTEIAQILRGFQGDNNVENIKDESNKSETIRATFVILYGIAVADGEITESELEVIKLFLDRLYTGQFNLDEEIEILSILDYSGMLERVTAAVVFMRENAILEHRISLARIFAQLVLIDGELNEEEFELLSLIGEQWGIDMKTVLDKELRKRET